MANVFTRQMSEIQSSGYIIGVIYITLSLVATSFKEYNDGAVLNNLIMKPANMITNPWSILTTSFIEIGFLWIFLGTIILVAGASGIERNWGFPATVKYMAIISIAPVLVTGVLYTIIGVITLNRWGIIKAEIYGIGGILSGFTVAFKQISAEYQARVFGGVITFRINYLPMVYLTVAGVWNTVRALLSSDTNEKAVAASNIVKIVVGVLTSWIYLRFYKQNGDIRGDLSEAFSFASFFPEGAIQNVAKTISKKIYFIAEKCRIVPSSSATTLYYYNTLVSNELENERSENNSQSRAVDINDENEYDSEHEGGDISSERRINLGIQTLNNNQR